MTLRDVYFVFIAFAAIGMSIAKSDNWTHTAR